MWARGKQPGYGLPTCRKDKGLLVELTLGSQSIMLRKSPWKPEQRDWAVSRLLSIRKKGGLGDMWLHHVPSSPPKQPPKHSHMHTHSLCGQQRTTVIMTLGPHWRVKGHFKSRPAEDKIHWDLSGHWTSWDYSSQGTGGQSPVSLPCWH